MPQSNKDAVTDLVAGLKADASPNGGVSNWQAIQWMALWAGPDFGGANVKLKGSGGALVAFVSGDHSRTTGLLGNGSSKYVTTLREVLADAQDNSSYGCYITTAASSATIRPFFGSDFVQNNNVYMGSDNLGGTLWSRHKHANFDNNGAVTSTTGINGMSRNAAGSYSLRRNGSGFTVSRTSGVPAGVSNNITFFYAQNATAPTTARMSMGWIGAAVDLAAMQTRMSTYMAALT